MVRIRQTEFARDQVTLEIDYPVMRATIIFNGQGIGLQDPAADQRAARDQAIELLQGLAKAIGQDVPGRVSWSGI